MSLARQSFAPSRLEVIVVDDGSEDDTADVCASMLGVLSNLRYVSMGENVGPARARNRGIELARGEYLLFTDDDCIAERNWVERMASALGREKIVSGAVESPSRSYLLLCHNISTLHAFMPGQAPGPKDFISGANMGFHRSVLAELGGFNEDFRVAEDLELVLRARSKGLCVYFCPKARVTHYPEKVSLGGIFRYAADHASKTILLRYAYRSFLRTPFVLRSPALLVAVAPLIALKVTVDIYLRNRSLARRIWTAPVVYALKVVWCLGAARGLQRRAS